MLAVRSFVPSSFLPDGAWLVSGQKPNSRTHLINSYEPDSVMLLTVDKVKRLFENSYDITCFFFNFLQFLQIIQQKGELVSVTLATQNIRVRN